MIEEKSERKEAPKKERVSIFIDGSNLYHSLKSLEGAKIDFEKLAKRTFKR